MVFLVMLFSTVRNQASAQVEASVSYQTFYDDLSPYGEWIDYPQYGYVWHPDINDFRPYSTGGHWVWTDDYGWMWASNYDWGWAPFHYGRWLYDDFYGWIWVPGYEWSPAWVEWRTGGDYYGWAPLGPGVDISLNFSFGRYSPPYNYWCFVPRNYILSPRVYDYCLPQSRNTVIINNTTIINDYHRSRNVFVTGPERSEVERYTGRINPFVLRESARPGRSEFRRNTVSIFRPGVQRNENNRFAPRNFERYNRQNGNAFQRREQDIANNNGERRNGFERRDQNNGRIEQRNNNINGNVFERRQQDINRNNNIRRQPGGQRNNFEQQQRENGNVERRQNEMRQQQEIRRQQLEQQNNIERAQRENRNVFERRQNEMRQQQDMQRQQQQSRNNFERRQNEMRQQENQRVQQIRQQQPQEQRRQVDQQRQNNGFERRQQQFNQQSQQQRGNPFQQRQEQSQGNGNGKGHGRHGHD